MKLNAFCLGCMLRKQEEQIRDFSDEEKKVRYLREVMRCLAESDESLSAPALIVPISKIYEKYWGRWETVETVKKEYNDLLLSMEADLEQKIRECEDVLQTALCYARTGNYIDFSALGDVSKEKFLSLLFAQGQNGLEEKEYRQFLTELHQAETLVYLTDNCGEIVLDKLVMKFLKESYPKLHITAIVRGQPVTNDADLEAAEYVGLPELVEVIGNGSNVAGTELSLIGEQAAEKIRLADIIISKGQGNFETLHGCGLNIYYLFLCKCDWFVRRFQVKKLEGIFVNERRMPQ